MARRALSWSAARRHLKTLKDPVRQTTRFWGPQEAQVRAKAYGGRR